MRKNLLVLLVLLCCLTGYSQGVVVSTTSNGNANPTQLVNYLLGTGACLVQPANAVKSTGLSTVNYAQGNSIGTFTNTNTAFPMTAGVVLVTGDATTASGPNTSISSDNSVAAQAWLGDNDLEAAFANASITINSMNATILEFDFTASTTSLSIPYVFASEEYGLYQCASKDGFAILLKVAGSPSSSYINLATIPTTTTPISVSTLRDNAFNSNCTSQNAQYFGLFNGGGAATTAANNFEGQSVLMNATYNNLVPGTTYHLKIVIADDGDANPTNMNGTDGRYNSAVFFPQGALNLGQQVVGNSLLLANNTALCEGDSYTINTGLTGAQYSFVWTKDNTTQVGTGSSLTVTAGGNYSLQVTNNNTSCTVTEAVNIEFAPQLSPGTPVTLYACPGGGTYTYNLALNTPNLKQGLDPATIVTYHATQAAANAGTGAVNASAYTTNGGTVTIYARVKSNNSSCFVVVPFDLMTIPAPTATQPANMQACEATINGGTAVFNLTAQDAAILGGQSATQNTVTYYTSAASAAAGTDAISTAGSYTSVTTTAAPTQTIYVRVQSTLSTSCFATTSFTIHVNPLPPVTTLPDVTACGSYTLPALTNGGNYFTQSGGLGTALFAGNQITNTQTIYIYSTNANCSNQSSFTATIFAGAVTPAPVTACQTYILPALQAGQEYHYQPNGGGLPIPAGTAINTTTTIYFYIPTASACTATSSFVVTIVVADDPADVNSCTPYTLPALTAGSSYWTASGGPTGTGTQLAAGTVITTSQLIYVYRNDASLSCLTENSFQVNVAQQVTPVPDIVRCGRYLLPEPAVGVYRTGSGGTGNVIAAGTYITTTQTIYLYYADPNVAGCSSEDSFVVTINPLPSLGTISDVSACTSYTLPSLSNLEFYNTSVALDGTSYSPGDVITSTTTIYAFSFQNAQGCRKAVSFTVTILSASAPNPGTQSACGSFTLPTLSVGKYYTLAGGPSAPGNTEILAGTVLTSTQTIHVYAVSGTAPNQCTSTSTFTITILPLPTLGNFPDVVKCNNYTLPALTNGAYYNGPDGTGGTIAAGTTLTASQTVYVYASSNTTPQCHAQKDFDVTIITGSIAPANVVSCGSYTLPALELGSYYNSANGVGAVVPAGTVITANTTMYVYTPVTTGTNCTGDDSFTITITTTPTVQELPDVVACNSYTLPALTAGNYYTEPDGPQGTGIMYPGAGGTVLTQSDKIYIFNSNPGCAAESDFQVTINTISAPLLADQTVCSDVGYALPALAPGYTYYTLAGGPATAGNVQLLAGDIVFDDTDIWTYGQIDGTSPLCFDQKSFHIFTVDPPAIDDLGTVASCTSYELPALTVGGNYFTGPGGTGTPLSAGQTIFTSQTIYIYAQGAAPTNCTSENEVTILVNPEPPADVTACDSYTLPVLPAGQFYRDAPSGGGNIIAGGTVITTTQTIYFYIPAAEACTDTASFLVTINHTPVLDAVSNVVECDEYILPALTVGNYYTLTGGPTGGGQVLAAGSAITSTQNVFVYAETGTTPNCFAETSFNVNITATPATVGRSDVEVCNSYTLPSLPAGYGYYLVSGGPNAPGQSQPPAVISTNADPLDGTMIYIYAAATANPDCFMETSFSVIIYSADVDSEIQDIYTNSTQTGSTYWAATSTETDTANPLFGQLVLDVESCDSYTLPDLNVGGTDPAETYLEHFYTLQGGPDVAGQQEVTNLTITASSTVYLYRRLTGRLDCSDESRIDIVINQTPVVDDSQGDLSDCFTHTLPALAVGNYYSSTGGNNPITNLAITSSQTIYIYAQTGVNKICSDEHSYVLTINSIDVPVPGNVISCDSYTLPVANPATARYFALSGGPGVAGQTEYPLGYTFLPGDYDIWVWDETHTTPNCTDEETFHIKVVARPTGIIPTGLITCAIDDAGHGIFDLTGAIAEAIGTQPLVAATIHLTLPDAQFGTNEWTDITNFTNGNATSQTIYIRLYSTLSTDCYTVVPLQLTVNPRPIAVDPIGPYQICDNGLSDTDGIGVFDLTTYQTAVLGTLDATLHTVTYYESIANIENGGPAIASPASYNTVSTTVYVKVTINATGCYDVVPLQLIVNPLPVVYDPTPLVLCDDNNPGNEKEVFDLTSKISEIMGGLINGVTATFHTTLADAEDNINEIGNPTAYENVTPAVQPIFVRITDNVTGCYRIVLLDIRVEPLPVLTQPTADELTVCSTNDDGFGNFDLDEIAQQMIDGGTNMTVAFFYTVVDAENGTNAITGTNDFENSNEFNDVIYVVATNTLTGCRSVVYTLNLVIDIAPVDVVLQDLTECDEDTLTQNGQTVFDLTVQDTAIYTQLGVAPGSYTIHYFTSFANADAGTPRITVPSAYVGTDAQVIWVRIEIPATACYIVTSFKLHVNKPELLAHPTPLILCDELPNDGFASFDLTQKDDEILTPFGIGEQNVVEYFILQADRDNGVNEITTPTAFTNTVAGYQTLYVLVTTPQGCTSKETLLLVVNPMPNPDFTPDPLVLCDTQDANLGDGLESFNLTDAAVNILAGDTQSVLTYYANAADEAAGIQIPDATNYTNVVPWDDTVIVRVTRTDTQAGSPACSQLVTLPLHVNPLPPVFNTSGVVPLYAICNDPTTGFEQFNLIGHITDLITAAGEDPTNFDIRFYATFADIAAGTALPHTYTNVTPGHQQIWVVVKNNTTDCTITTTLDLYAEQAAVANPITSAANSPIVECDYDGTNDGFTQFDLTPAGTEALGSQSPTQFSVEYYTTEAAAITGDTTAAEYIATPAAYTNTVNPQTIWVRITNTSTFSPCFAVTSFNIRVSLLEEPSISNDDNDHFICVDYKDGTVYKPVPLKSNATTAGDTYQWYLNGTAIPGATSATYSAVEEGIYTVEVWNADGCISDPVTGYEIFLSGPASKIGEGYVVSNAFGDNQTITVLAEGFGDYQYALVAEDANGNSDPLGPWQNSNVFTNVQQGYFTIYVRDVNTLEINPCGMLVISGVSVIDYPKYFTPNGDGINDYWNIVGMVNHPEARIYIFDRYGKLIKQLSPASRTDHSEGWDGTFNGQPLPSDDYWFTVEFTESGYDRTFKAHFAMKR